MKSLAVVIADPRKIEIRNVDVPDPVQFERYGNKGFQDRGEKMNLSMSLKGLFAVIGIGAAVTFLCESAECEDYTRTFTIVEPVGLDWQADRVDYRVKFPEGKVAPGGVSLKDAGGQAVAVQLSDIDLWPDGKAVKSGTVSFIASLKANETAAWTLTGGKVKVSQPDVDLKTLPDGRTLELTTSCVGIRVPLGEEKFPDGGDAKTIPAPIQSVRLLDGKWIGKGWWTTVRPCLRYSSELVENGPVFARVKLSYEFTDRTAYDAIIELNAGAEFAQIREEFNLSQGKAYPMPEQPGEDKGRLYRYVVPRFDNTGGAKHWDWWGGTHGKVATPNSYQFSFYEGLKPDSLEWHGRMANKAAEAGDGGLKYPDDKRVISINAFMNWGDDECVLTSAYNSASPASGELCIMGLRPSQWLNPDLDPHPIATIKQFTQTNNLWIERRTKPDIFLRVPTCLGRRMFAIGILPRRQETKKDAGGKDLTMSVSDLPLRYIRLGRTRLDEVKDWVTYYDEPGKYPRLAVKAGDLQALLDRVRNNGITQGDSNNPAISYLFKPGPETAKALIAMVTKDRARSLLHGMLTGLQQDHNQYWMWFTNWIPNADVALGIPEISAEERRELLRLIAAHAYLASSQDFVPGREQGYGWGSINMPVQLRTGIALAASLLPNHPRGTEWRRAMSDYFSDELLIRTNLAGASEEVGAYGAITVNAAALVLGSLSRSDPSLDIGPAIGRMKAVANYRMQYLSPYDPRMGFRPATPIGDSAYDGESTLPLLSYFLSANDPRLGAQLAWCMRETGCKPDGGWTPTSLFVDFSTPAVPPPLSSEHLEGAGIIMRNGFPDRDETYVNINAGGYSFGHGHMDRGCFVMYSKGDPLMLDFGSQYQPAMRLTWNHNGGITFDNDESMRKLGGMNSAGSWFNSKTRKPDKDYEIEPFTCLMPGMDPKTVSFEDMFGKVTSFVSLPSSDYGIMEQKISYLDRVPYMTTAIHGQQWLTEGGCSEPAYLKHPFTLVRRYVFVKSKDLKGPQYLVIRDHMPANTDLRSALNFWCLADKLEVNGQRAAFTGQHGVDLDIFVAEPSKLQYATHKLSQENPRAFGDFYKKAFGRPFKEEQTLFQIQQQPGGGFFTVLVPRKTAEAAPKFETVLDGNGIRISFPDGRVDTIVLAPARGEYEVEGKKLHGDAFLVSRTGQDVQVTALEAGSIR